MLRNSILIVFLSLIAFSGNAQKVLGSQIDYIRIDSFTYQVRLMVYSDCRDSAFQLDTNSYFLLRDTGSSTLLAPTLTAIRDISTYNDTITPCVDSLMGIVANTYIDTIDFKDSFSAYKSSEDIWFEFHTDRMLVGSNVMCGSTDTFRKSRNYAYIKLQSWPRGTQFYNDPLFLVASNAPVFTAHLATPNNGMDSVTYRFAKVYNDTGEVSWNCTGSRWNNPFESYYLPVWSFPFNNPNASPPLGVYLNPTTSELIYTPVSGGSVDNFGIEAKLWQDDSTGVKRNVGEIRRELFHFVQSSQTNRPPKVKGPYSFAVCAGSTLCFNVETEDDVFVLPPPAPLPSPDTVRTWWDSTLSHLGATFTITNPTARLQNGRFCFTPDDSLFAEQPYYFTAYAKDNRGIVGGQVSRVFRISVKMKAMATSFSVLEYCSPSLAVRHTVVPDSSSGFTFSCIKELLDSAGRRIRSSMDIRFGSTASFVSSGLSDVILGDTTGVFIVKSTVSNFPLNCPLVLYDTMSLSLSTPEEVGISDTLLFCDVSGDTLHITKDWRSIRWSTGDTMSSIYIDSAGSYAVFLEDSCGNIDRRDFEVFIQYTPSPIFPDAYICSGEAVQYIYEDSLPHSILWSTGSLSDTFVSSRSTSYFVYVSNRCSSVRDTFIVYENWPRAHIEEVYAACDTVILKSVIDFGVDVESYWVVGNDTIYDSVLLISSDKYVQLRVRTRCKDVYADYLVVTPRTLPTVSVAEDFKFSCNPTGAVFRAAGRYVDSAVWSTGTVGSSLTVSSYDTFYVANVNECGAAYDTVTYFQNKKPVFQIKQDSSICDQIILYTDISQGINCDTFWYIGPIPYVQDSFILTTSQAASAYVSNACGTTLKSISSVNIPIAPQVSIVADTLLFCDLDTADISATGNFSSMWSWSTGEQGDGTVVTGNGVYIVRNTRYCGDATDSVVVVLESTPSIYLPSDTSVCNEDSLLIVAVSGRSGLDYTWDNDLIAYDSTVWVTASAWYTVRARNNCGDDTASIQVKFLTVEPFSLGPDTSFASLTVYVELAGPSWGDALWSTADTSASIIVQDTGLYWLEVSNECGAFRDSIVVFYDSTLSVLPAPQVGINIYPNPSDGKVYLNLSGHDFIDLKIYNSLGVLVAKQLNFSGGEISLSYLPSGQYTFQVSVHNWLAYYKLVLIR